jgi:enoyl-CoA hydratase/3-hydroxyacyl-CoA dehydrogenase
MKTLGMPMGPYETMDYTGLDINFHVCSYFAETIHPDFAMGTTLAAKVESGDLGKKTGKGIYDWSKGRPEIDLSKATPDFDLMDLVSVNVNEATKIVEMGVCNFEDIDTAIINATGNPMGLMGLVKDMEPDDLVKRLEGLAKKFGKEIFKPSKMIKEGKYR